MLLRNAILVASTFATALWVTDAGAVPANFTRDRVVSPSAMSPLAPLHATPCVDGMAGIYPCSNIDLLAFVPVADFSATSTNSLWGWTDPSTQIEYALIGTDRSIAFFDLATPDHPRFLGSLPTHAGTGSSAWRDVRVYANYAYVVSDNNGAHGMQVFDLTRLRQVTTPQTFTENAHRADFTNGHTISINEISGFAYVAGSNTCGMTGARGGLRMYDIRTPSNPLFVGCISEGGYTHEAQCWNYAGPDPDHAGREICVNANGPNKRIAIVDVTNKASPVTLSSSTYTGAAYPHQGWLTDDHRYLLVNDELDESGFGHDAWTWIWDVSDLDAPVLVGKHDHAMPVIDHNLYVHGNHVYASNYEAGLRILRIDNLSQAAMTEVAWFDVYPQSDSVSFNGTWNNYRFPRSGNVIVTGIDEGFFVLKPQLCAAQDAPDGLLATPAGDQRIDLLWNAFAPAYRVERAQGGCAGVFETIANDVTASPFSDAAASGEVDYGYRVVATDTATQCASPASDCVVARTTGACTAPPLFAGVVAANAGDSAICHVALEWNAATPACAGAPRYSVYRSDTAGFEPGPSNRIAEGIVGSDYSDTSLQSGVEQFYVVRASDSSNASEERNRIERAATPRGLPVDGSFSSGAEPGEPPFDTSAAGNALQRLGETIRHAGWHMSTSRVRGGIQSFWSTAANNLCVSLVSPTITLTAGESPRLKFWNVWDIEQGRDGGVVEISIDQGATWTRLTPDGGYPGSINSGGSLCGVAQGDGAFTGRGQFSWLQHEVSLSAYAGESVQLRWLYRTDQALTGEGWFIDDIEVTHAQVPGICISINDFIFRNGFESTAN